MPIVKELSLLFQGFVGARLNVRLVKTLERTRGSGILYTDVQAAKKPTINSQYRRNAAGPKQSLKKSERCRTLAGLRGRGGYFA